MLFLDSCMGLLPLDKILVKVVDLLKFGIPILLIIFGMMDLGKAVMAGKEDEMKKAQGTLIKRFIYAVAVFLVVTLVQLVMGLVDEAKTEETGDLTNGNWLKCWNEVSRGEI